MALAYSQDGRSAGLTEGPQTAPRSARKTGVSKAWRTTPMCRDPCGASRATALATRAKMSEMCHDVTQTQHAYRIRPSTAIQSRVHPPQAKRIPESISHQASTLGNVVETILSRGCGYSQFVLSRLLRQHLDADEPARTTSANAHRVPCVVGRFSGKLIQYLNRYIDI